SDRSSPLIRKTGGQPMRMTVNRRKFLASSAMGALTLSGGLAMPAIVRAAQRPQVSHGLQAGDVDATSGMIWARSSQPARRQVEVATTESFTDAVKLPSVAALPESDLAVKQLLTGLPSDQTILYRVSFTDLADVNAVSEAVTGQFRTAPLSRRP